ncbi:MAG: phosphoenolpyruvate carboxykinase (GTP) [Desulfosarcinaceae bacterium]|nr:phosphoenolpyruvate carboxykinase (GTP) [Desulfosarcinaceae bacterium]
MLKRNHGIDIALELGGIASHDDAQRIFAERLTPEQLARIRQITCADALIKIANAIVMCAPETVFINTGSDADIQLIRKMALAKGEEAPLAMAGHTLHFDLKEEQGRIIDRTFYIANEEEQISSLAQRISRGDALETIKSHLAGLMQGMTMIVGFYSRGPVGSAAADPAIEITSSAYVSHSAEILYRNCYASFDNQVSARGYFYTNIHSEGANRAEDLPNARVFMDRSYQTTYSFNCTYAGNTLLLKKGNHRFSVDRACHELFGQQLAEHMFITGIEGPGGRITWMTGAAPSGCGKTTTAMAGDHFVGDDLAQMWLAEDGGIRSINPECGIFGIVEDVNREGDPMLMQCLREPGTEVIWSNVLVDDEGVPHWVGNGEEHPAEGRNFQGAWKAGLEDKEGKPVPLSHPNARCTVSASALGNYSDRTEDPAGVETRIFTYSGRDSNTMPPVWVAKTPSEGVVIGACIVSAATATEVGASGVKRAPWANAPFIPGSLGDYMRAQFAFFNSPKLADAKRPIMAGLNYFLTDEARGGERKTLLGEKRDVKVWMAWLERLVHGEVETIESPIGLLPRYEDLVRLFQEKIAKTYPRELYEKQFSLYVDNILARVDLQLAAYGKDAEIPETLFEILENQKADLMALKGTFGAVVAPDQLQGSPEKG